MAAEVLIETVADDLPKKLMQPAAIVGIAHVHGGPAPNRIHTAKHFDISRRHEPPFPVPPSRSGSRHVEKDRSDQRDDLNRDFQSQVSAIAAVSRRWHPFRVTGYTNFGKIAHSKSRAIFSILVFTAMTFRSTLYSSLIPGELGSIVGWA